jgi:uncharacterized glyoxalase superfamily protein PhnB
MQKSLEFYTKTLGFQATDTLKRKDGRIVHASVGFDSPLLMLSPVEDVQSAQSKENLTTNKLGVGVEFHIGMNDTKKIDQFFTEVKSRGIKILNEPKTEFWGKRNFTVNDPDGYAITFSEHVSDITPEAFTAAYEAAHSVTHTPPKIM